jgi:GLPGLI family protein
MPGIKTQNPDMDSNPEIREKIENMRKSRMSKKVAQLVISDKVSLYSSVDEDLLTYKNLETDELIGRIEIDGKKYITEETLRKYDWKTGTERKTVAGHECIQATTQIQNQNIVAWYATDIPIDNGPKSFGGLPGLILRIELNNDMVVSNCISIEQIENTPEIQKPVQGEKISIDGLNRLLWEKMTKKAKEQRGKTSSHIVDTLHIKQ